MAKFWPSTKLFQGSTTVKFKAVNLKETLEHKYFRVGDTLPDVENTGFEYTTSNKNEIRIVLFPRNYANYQDFNWLNVNYFLSDYNYFLKTVEKSFWFVSKATPMYVQKKIERIEYILKLDEWSTFYDYIWNFEGICEINEMHNNRWIKDKDGNYTADLINNPFISNCNRYCARYNNKIEMELPKQIYDSKHIGFDLKPNEANKEFFEIDENNNVINQLRGWILVWGEPDKAGEVGNTLIGKVVIPYKLFMYPIKDMYDKNKYLAGLKWIQENGYRIIGANVISDILDYATIQKSSADGWYDSSSNDFSVNISNGFIDNSNNFMGKHSHTQTEIANELFEPHLDSLTHSHFELSNVNKNKIMFSINQLIKNPGFIKPPVVDTEEDKPILQSFNGMTSKNFGIMTLREEKNSMYGYFYECLGKNTDGWGDIIYWPYENGKPIYEKSKKEFLSYKIENGIPILNNDNTFSLNINYIHDNNPSGSYPLYDINNKEYIKYTGAQPIISFKYYQVDKIANTIYGTNNLPDGQYGYSGNSGKKYARLTLLEMKDSLSAGQYETTILNGFDVNDLENPGPYNDTVIGYDITGFSNGRYQATHWFVLYNKELYRFPIGQLTPRQYSKFASNYYWYDELVTVITKNIAYFSPEQMGLKSILLDTETTMQNKLNSNTMSLNVSGSYQYPYYSDSYNEFWKGKMNSFAAGYENIETKLSNDKYNAGMGFLSGLFGAGGSAGSQAVTGGKAGPWGAAIGLVGNVIGGAIDAGTAAHTADVNAEMARNTLDAQINDAKNLQDNIGVTGTASTMSDTILKEFIEAQSMFKDYWNFWTPVLHKFELSPVDKASVRNYYNKFGYKQNRMVMIQGFKDLCTRWAFNRVKLGNPYDLSIASGMSHEMIGNVLDDLSNGVFIWDLDRVPDEDILNYNLNNYEEKLWENIQSGLDKEIETEVN